MQDIGLRNWLNDSVDLVALWLIGCHADDSIYIASYLPKQFKSDAIPGRLVGTLPSLNGPSIGCL